MATFTVTNLNDSGTGSLREAISAANAAGGSNTITFDASLKGGTLTLTNGELDITTDITIDGEIDGTDITIDGNDASRVFKIDDGNPTSTITATLNGLVIQHGSSGAYSGGGIYVGGADILKLSNSTVSHNQANNEGGGIYAAANADLSLYNVTLSANTATLPYAGGGIFGGGAVIVLTNCTVSDNSAGLGGGIGASSQSYVGLLNTTVSGNLASASGGGLLASGAYTSTTITNSIVAGNRVSNLAYGGGDDLAGGLQAGDRSSIRFVGGNIVGSTPLDFATKSGTYTMIDGTNRTALETVFASVGYDSHAVLSGTLANNGGPVETIALAASATNPAIDAANDSLAHVPTTDARGFARYDFPGVANNGASISDLGAFELQPETPSLVVTTANDVVDPFDGLTSLREALAFANSNPNASTITFDPSLAGDTLTLTNGELDITSAITIDGDIDGNGTPDITIDAGGHSRVFEVSAGSSTLDGLILTNGTATKGGGTYVDAGATVALVDSTLSDNSASAEGGGIYSRSATVSVSNSTLSGNSAGDFGGGIYNSHGTLTVSNSTLSDNSAHYAGGAIRSFYGTLTVSNSTLSGNSATFNGQGGGLFIDHGTAGLIATTLSDDSASYDGGGIFSYHVALTLTDTTLSGNSAGRDGGGIENSGGTLKVVDTTLSGNSAASGGGIYAYNATTALTNSIVAGNAANTGAADLYGTGSPSSLTFTGGNILGSAPSGFNSVTGTYTKINGTNQAALERVFASVGNDPHTHVLSGVLADNGGPVETVAIQIGGLAQDTGVTADLPPDTYDLNNNGNTTEPLPVDARGEPRVFGASVDIGAFEAQREPTPTPTNLVVTTLADETYNGGDYTTESTDGNGLSLREAIGLANAAGGSHTITFDPTLAGGTLTLTNGELDIASSVTIEGDIDGNGTPDITIDAGGHSRVFEVSAGSSTLDGLILTNGRATKGGGTYVDAGATVALVDSTLSDNSASAEGGGIYSHGATVTVSNSTLSGNSADAFGGGIYNSHGTLTVSNSTLSDNSAHYAGGAIRSFYGTLTVSNSTLSGNSATFNGQGGGLFIDHGTAGLIATTLSDDSAGYDGGGIFSYHVALTLTDTTLSGNSAGRDGGGIENSGGTLKVVDTTLSGNSAASGGGIYAYNATTALTNSIVAGNAANTGAADLYGTGSPSSLTFTGGNILGSAPSGFNSVTGTYTKIDGTNQAALERVFASVGNDPHTHVLSGVLADNGGLVPTVALNPTGVAINAGVTTDLPQDTFDLNHNGNTTEPLPVDARGFSRVVGSSVDIGAFEQQAGQSFVVTTLNDELNSTNPNATLADEDGGTGLSLREALFLANEDPTTADTITFASNLSGGTIDLTLGQLKLSGGVTIDGDINGDTTPDITVDAEGSSRVFDAVYGTSTISGLTITGGYAGGYGAGDGGAVKVGRSYGSGGSYLTISNSTITNSQAAYGGGLAVNYGDSLQLTNTTVSGNGADYVGGGIANKGALTLTNSTVSGNSSGYIGGGIASLGTLTITDSTLSNNQITGAGSPPLGYVGATAGAGLYNSGSATLLNATISGNSGAYAGSGIYNSEALTLTNVTLANNSATNGGGLYNAACGCGNVSIYDTTVTGNDATQLGGGIDNANGSVTLTNSIVAGNSASYQGPDAAASGLATTIYAGVNLFSQAGVGRAGTDINVSPSDLSQVFASLTTIDPDGVPNSGDEFQAGTLASNGGAVETVLIEAGGDAENNGDNGALPPGLTDDARGDPRVANGTVDLGALEVQAPTPVISNPNAVIAVAGTGAIALDIAAPTDSDGSTPTITLDTLPTYGTTQYFNGTTFVTATAGATLTPTELASLEYTPPASGEFGGQTISYTATDQDASTTGTIAVTVLVDDTGSSNLYFTAFAGPGNGGNPDLYTLDANGNPLAIPMSSPNGSTAGEDGGFIQYAGNLYFNAFNPSTGDALYVLTPGSTTPTPVLDTNGNVVSHFEQIASNFSEFDGSLYFVDFGNGSTATGIGLFRLDPSGVATPINLNPNAFDQFLNNGFVDFDNNLYFAAYTGAPNDSSLFELSPGSNTPTDADPSNLTSFDGEDGGFVVFNNTLYFNAFSNVLGEDTLFELKPGSITPEPVDPTNTVLSHETGVTSAFHQFDGNLYFNELSTADSNDTLFKLGADGTLTALEYQSQPLVNAGEFNGFVDFAGSTYFAADLAGVTTLFKLNTSGTITPIYDGGGTGAFDANLASGFVVFNDSLYFDAFNVAGDSLYKLSANGTLTTVNLGGGPGTTDAGIDGGFQIVGNNLYFSAFTSNGYELVRLGADGTVQQFDINPGTGNNSFGTGGSLGNALGVFPGNIINGTSGNDILVGTTPNEIINGGPGNDILEGRGGNDILTGGDGADTFTFSLAGAPNVDTVTDYSLAQGDVLGVSALVDTNFTAGSQIVDFVRLIASGSDLVLQVDPNGSADNPHVWQDVAILDNANVAPVNEVTAFFAGADHTITQTTDFTSPTVQSVVFNAPGSVVGVGALITVTVNMSEPVMVETTLGAPTLGLNDGGVATFDAADSTSTALVFDYTVLAGQSTPALATSPLGVSLNGGTIEDLAANEADLAGSDNVTAVPTIEVGIRPPPTQTTHTVNVKEGASTGTLSAGDSDPDGDSITVTGVIGGTVGTPLAGTYGTLTLNANDTFSYTANNLTAIIAAPPGNPTDSFTYTVSNGHGGTATETLNLVIQRSHAVDDYNADLMSDVLWRNSDGSLAEWLMNGSAITSAANPSYQGSAVTPASSWSVVGTGDFNNDGRADILWQFTDGSVADWTMSGSTISASDYLRDNGQVIAPDSSWSIAGIGDFNGGGDADIIWRQSTTGSLAEWSMDGSTITSSASLAYQGNVVTPDSTWSVTAVGDFNGDGKADMLWRQSTTGSLAEWQMNGATIASSGNLIYQGSAVSPDASWSIAGVGDFNGDGNTDILWRQSTTGSLAIWLMNGSTIASSAAVTSGGSPVTPNSTWNVVEVGDFNGGNTAGILWQQSTTGTLAEWQMNGAQIVSSQFVTSAGAPIAPASTWQVQAKPTDFV